MNAILASLRTLGKILTEPSEWSQGLTRVIITALFTGYFLIETSPAVFVGMVGFVAASFWLIWIHLVPSVQYRSVVGSVLDISMISAALFLAGPHHPGLMLMYFWVVIGNGYRFSPSYALLSMVATFVTFWISVLSSDLWSNHLVAAAEFTSGFTLISWFTYKLLSNLESMATEARTYEQRAKQLETKSKRDGLTGLCNREAAYEILNKAVSNSTRVGVLFVDLDNFKHFNDTYGHHVGDDVLINISKRLTNSVRAGDVVCRYAGDEFVVIVDDEDKDTINRVAERITTSMNAPIGVKDNPELVVTGSIGIAILGIHGQTTQDVLRNADSAMYMAKRLGRNQVAWFEEKIGS